VDHNEEEGGKPSKKGEGDSDKREESEKVMVQTARAGTYRDSVKNEKELDSGGVDPGKKCLNVRGQSKEEISRKKESK